MTHEQAEKMADDAAEKLGEHFDHVQILATWNEEGITKSIRRGTGNFYARLGMAHEFINADVAQENAQQIADKINPEDDSNSWKT